MLSEHIYWQHSSGIVSICSLLACQNGRRGYREACVNGKTVSVMSIHAHLYNAQLA
jgi:hypothetical protein